MRHAVDAREAVTTGPSPCRRYHHLILLGRDDVGYLNLLALPSISRAASQHKKR